MRTAPHPFAAGGGGTRFEYRVATLLVADLLRGRFTEHDGTIEALVLQSGPPAFDDIEIRLQLIDGGHRTVHTQCRHRQPFSAGDEKHRQLLTEAKAILDSDGESFAAGQRRLAVVVDHASPAWESMRRLCDLARSSRTFREFDQSVATHGGQVDNRFQQALQAAPAMDAPALWEVLANLEVRAVDLDATTSRDYVEMINRLAEGWSVPNAQGAVDLANAVYAHVSEVGSRGGAVDIATLRRHVGRLLPPNLDASTRRSRLYRRREAGERRVMASLGAIGVDETLARTLCARALEAPLQTTEAEITVLTGPLGVGKTTELERRHRAAIDRAIADHRGPIPIFLNGTEVRDAPLMTAVSDQAEGIGDPAATGVHLVIDGLDEAGLTVDELARRVVPLLSEWPGSTAVLATRPQSSQSQLPVVTVEPLSEDSAIALMKAVDPHAPEWMSGRVEFVELLCRPLFAIRYALDRGGGRASAIHEAHLVDSVGQWAAAELGPTDGTFELLVNLASRIIDAGGAPVALRAIGATPPQVSQAIRSRLLHVVDGRATFQLAVLTEWFAATALLRSSEELLRSVASPQQAWRWRYAHVQALLQGSATDVDTIMALLLNKSPATAAWVFTEAETPFGEGRVEPLARSATEAGRRVRNAATAWLAPWPAVAERWLVDGAMPTLGVSMQGTQLTTAWHGSRPALPDTVVPMPSGTIGPFDPRSDWVGGTSGSPRPGETWPWGWTFPPIQREIDGWIESGTPVGDVDVCWPELAWTFAHTIIGRSATVQADPVPRAALEAVIADLRSRSPIGEVMVGTRGRQWRLTDGEGFVDDLAHLGVDSVVSPWPAADTRGGWTWLWWTTHQLLRRLNLATKAALDAYQILVQRHFSAMAPYLSTFQMLPARISGTLIAAKADGGWEGQARYAWHLEPLPREAPNEAHWRLAEEAGWADESTWEHRRRAIRELRPEAADLISLSEHHGEPEILSPTPASSLALSILVQDLGRFRWTHARVGRYEPLVVRPKYGIAQ